MVDVQLTSRKQATAINGFITALLLLKKKKLNFYYTRLVPVNCNELAEPIAATRAKAYSARLHRWRVEGNLS